MLSIFVLSGGLATRLGNLTKDTPKSLIEINNKPFIHWQLELLEQNKFREVTICLGHLSKKIVQYIENYYSGQMNIHFSFDGQSKIGTGGAIKKACSNSFEPFFVVYGDSYLDIQYQDVCDAYELSNGPLMTILYNSNKFDKSNIYTKNGKFYYSKNNPNKNANYIDYGLSIFEKKHFNKFNDVFDLSKVQEFYSQQNNMQFFEVKKRFYEIGSKKGINDFSNYIKNK